jgi:hypothetical protein
MTICFGKGQNGSRHLCLLRIHELVRVAAIVALLWATPVVSAEFPGRHPFPGVTYEHRIRKRPPMHLYIAEVDLTRPGLKIRTSPAGPDPDGPGEWQTTLLEPTKVAARENLDLVVNGDFFKARNVEETDTFKPHYRADMWAYVVGPAATGGKIWSTSKEPMPCLIVQTARRVSIQMISFPPADAEEAIAGNVLLVENGKPITHEGNQARYPRTVVGLNKQRTRLIILVVDGRKPGVSIGMTFEELAKELVHRGCYMAFNLDGGGSSMLAMRNPVDGQYRILNSPSTGHERAVANILGIAVENQNGRLTRHSSFQPGSADR